MRVCEFAGVRVASVRVCERRVGEQRHRMEFGGWYRKSAEADWKAGDGKWKVGAGKRVWPQTSLRLAVARPLTGRSAL
jgi:hypothetical protein